ncbi:COG4702 Uncharacterized conserved protein [Candidatus Planktophila dulcis]|uniref:heme-binding protein n=1 Tax=Candidatus Planktophila dulcis TaxID=1884914 RepID=UPI003BEF3788
MNLAETGGFSSGELIAQAQALTLASLNLHDAVSIGESTAQIAELKTLPVSIEVRIGSWCVYHISLEGSSEGHDSWIDRKSAVVEHSKNASLLELVLCEEQNISWYEKNGLSENEFAANGGAIPLKLHDSTLGGVLIVSGLAGPDDHRLAVAGLQAFLSEG